MSDTSTVVVPAGPSASADARQAATRLARPFFASLSQADAVATPGDVAVVVDTDRAWLQQLGNGAPGPVFLDFASPSMEHRRKGGQNELLGRAVGIKQGSQLEVLDATAGLGRDGFVLADSGCRVVLAERSPELAWLLEQAIDAARISGSEHVRHAAMRMAVYTGDCRSAPVPEGGVIYLDPMFNERKTAAVKKDLSLLQALYGSQPSDADALLEWALAQPVRKVVVKRAIKAPRLAGRVPSHSLKGKAVRFDVYPCDYSAHEQKCSG